MLCIPALQHTQRELNPAALLRATLSPSRFECGCQVLTACRAPSASHARPLQMENVSNFLKVRKAHAERSGGSQAAL